MPSRWQEIYKQKLMSAEEAIKLIPQGAFICSPLTNGQPPSLLNAMAKRMAEGDLRGAEYLCSLAVRVLDLHNPEIIEKINQYNTLSAMYCGPLERYFINQGLYQYVPHRLFDGPMMIERYGGMQVGMITVSPMDKHGYFSTGIHPDYIYEFIHRSPGCIILAEVNENMPRTYGINQFHVSEITALVEKNIPLVALPEVPMSEKDDLIGQYIAELVPDGACLQLGIGNIPNAVAKHLGNKHDLGIHSEMLCDSMIDLYEQGVITGKKKQLLPGKWVACFAFGSQRLYDFVHENPMVEMHGAELVNDPYKIGLNDKVISINSTLEIDLAGQCASEAIGTQMYSGAGGQMDYTEGAWRSKGGKAFLALHSTYTDKAGQLHSRIVPTLSEGSLVTTTRNDVQYVVTEYGVAYLKGSNMQKRVKELIRIAHPDFRDYLADGARRLKYL